MLGTLVTCLHLMLRGYFCFALGIRFLLRLIRNNFTSAYKYFNFPLISRHLKLNEIFYVKMMDQITKTYIRLTFMIRKKPFNLRLTHQKQIESFFRIFSKQNINNPS